jgi:hypothetical protein
MGEARLLVVGVSICASGGSATVTGLDQVSELIVPSSISFPSLTATQKVARVGRGAIERLQLSESVFLAVLKVFARRVFQSPTRFRRFHFIGN